MQGRGFERAAGATSRPSCLGPLAEYRHIMQLAHAKQLPLFEAASPRRAVVVERIDLDNVREVPLGRGPVAFQVLLALPGRVDALAERLGLSQRQVFGALGQLGVRGLALRLNGPGPSGVWARP